MTWKKTALAQLKRSEPLKMELENIVADLAVEAETTLKAAWAAIEAYARAQRVTKKTE